MRTYLATLHKKSDHHKKRFAFLASASFTMMIFTVWSLVNFGLPDSSKEVAVKSNNINNTEIASPFDSLRSGVAAGIQAIGGTLGEAKAELEQVDFEGEYGEMRNNAFESYGR